MIWIRQFAGVIMIFNVGVLEAEVTYGFWALFSRQCWFMIYFRTTTLFQMCPPLIAEVVPAAGLLAYSIWGLGPTTRILRRTVFKVLWSILIVSVSFFLLQSRLDFLIDFFSMSFEILLSINFDLPTNYCMFLQSPF